MALVNASLLLGGLLLAIPVVLHLVMRQQPRHVIFPALRFIQQRQDANRRQLRLRHALLLLLRGLAIGLLALVLARPSVPRAALGDWIVIGILVAAALLTGALAVLTLWQRRGRWLGGGLSVAAAILMIASAVMASRALARDESQPLGDERAPVAAVLVFDASPRMQYTRQNRTRLDEARDIAAWLIRQLPPDSEVAVLDSRPGGAAFAVDLAAARRSVERLQTTGVPLPLTEVIEQALRLTQASAKPRKEVYVFSDLSRAAWTDAPPDRLAQRLRDVPDALWYVIDVGVDAPRNVSVSVPRLNRDVLAAAETLEVQANVACLGPGGTYTVELRLEDPSIELPMLRDGQVVLPESKLRAMEIVELPDNGSKTVRFRVAGLGVGVQQGTVRIAETDALACDNTRFFAVETQPAVDVLVLAPPGVQTKYFVEALAPDEFRRTGRARFACRIEDQSRLASLSLDDYSAVCLLDPTPLTPATWDALARYVRDGGGLGVFLGHNADPDSWNAPAARLLTGGRLDRAWRTPGDVFVTARDLSHPLLAAFRDLAANVPWDRFPVYRHWGLEDLAPAARIVVRYSNTQPAIIETTLGRGRALTMTTPLSDPARPPGRQAWNELPTGEDAWPFVVLVHELARYLTGADATRLNYLTGQTASLPNAHTRQPARYQLFSPSDLPQDVTADEDSLSVKFTETPGAYRLKGFLEHPVVRGFAVNLPESASQLERLDRTALDEMFGAGRAHYARNQDQIVLGVGEARMGREFYPFLLLLLALTLGLEHLLSNRFYRRGE